jgi:hypothetical protein
MSGTWIHGIWDTTSWLWKRRVKGDELRKKASKSRDLANRVYEELGDWVSDARLSVVVLTEEDSKFMKLEFV